MQNTEIANGFSDFRPPYSDTLIRGTAKEIRSIIGVMQEHVGGAIQVHVRSTRAGATVTPLRAVQEAYR